jgi:hypothetical protein
LNLRLVGRGKGQPKEVHAPVVCSGHVGTETGYMVLQRVVTQNSGSEMFSNSALGAFRGEIRERGLRGNEG